MTTEDLRDIVAPLLVRGNIRFSEPMSRHTSLRIGGPADIFVVPSDRDSLLCILEHLKKHEIPLFALGAGTNVLVTDKGIAGAVICFRSLDEVAGVFEDDETVCLSVDAGTMLGKLIMYAGARGYEGIEGLAGIPGTVGGAICGNAGSFGYEMKDVLLSIDILRRGIARETIAAGDLSFGYRRSGIPREDFVVSATVRMKKGKRDVVMGRIEHFLNEKRRRQPLWELSAGCVFKNPEGLSAGKLIDEAGCKGMRIGDVVVSTVHANFFVNVGNASAADFVRLMNEVAERVNAMFGIVLEPEIKIVGRENGNG